MVEGGSFPIPKVSEQHLVISGSKMRKWKVLWTLVVLAFGTVHCQDCETEEKFEAGSICPLTIENVIDIQTKNIKMENERGCQYICYRDDLCKYFTFFRNDKGIKCVLFKSCEEMSDCQSCVTGPSSPSNCTDNKVEDSPEFDDVLDLIERARSKIPLLENAEEIIETAEDFGEDASEESPSEEQNSPPTRTTLVIQKPRTNPVSVEEDEEIEDTPVRPQRPRRPSRPSGSGRRARPRRPSSSGDRRPSSSGERDPKQFDDQDVDDDDDENTVSIEGIDEGLLTGDDDVVDLPDEDEVNNRQTEDSDDAVPVLEDDEPEEDDEDEEAFDDEYFDEIDEAGNARPGPRPQNGRKPSFYHCLMGGYGPTGPMPSVRHMGRPSRRSRVTVPSLPLSFPLGYSGTYGTVYKDSILSCSPGARTQSSSLFFGTQQSSTPGACYSYSPNTGAWRRIGGSMNTFRSGASIVRVGSFMVASGGDGFPSSLDSMEVLNLRNPRRWVTLPRQRLPRTTFDHCTVAINKTSALVTGGVGQESQAIVMNLKRREARAMSPMKQPRRKHTCMKAEVNGRSGVIVAGGESDANPNLASVEFFDMKSEKWLSLGRLRQGRRFPGMSVMGGRLVVAGGEATDQLGRTVILDSLETLRRRTWRPIRQRLAERRSRFGVLRIPRSFF